jgi:hypothetical protein
MLEPFHTLGVLGFLDLKLNEDQLGQISGKEAKSRNTLSSTRMSKSRQVKNTVLSKRGKSTIKKRIAEQALQLTN